jgi:hypothetical protein
MDNQQEQENIPLSASRIKTLQSCSWLYYANYVLQLSGCDEGNYGSLRGTCCHAIFECLGKGRHKKLYDQTLKGGTIKGCPAILRYVNNYVRKHFAEDDREENFGLIDQMTIEGLNCDFFGEERGKPTQAISEKSFDLNVIEGDINYRIRGFIDKLFLYDDKSLALIRDFKTSKAIFEGKDYHDNIQDLSYRLATKKLFPQYRNREMEFLFIKFDCCSSEASGHLKMPKVEENELNGFEHFLTVIQRTINSFDKKDAMSNLAASQGYPAKDEGFCKNLMCGYSKHDGHIKPSTGLPYWHCSMKWKFDYFAVIENDKVIKTSRSKEDLAAKLKRGQKIKEMHYEGCPAHNKVKTTNSKPNQKRLI